MIHQTGIVKELVIYNCKFFYRRNVFLVRLIQQTALSPRQLVTSDLQNFVNNIISIDSFDTLTDQRSIRLSILPPQHNVDI